MSNTLTPKIQWRQIKKKKNENKKHFLGEKGREGELEEWVRKRRGRDGGLTALSLRFT